LVSASGLIESARVRFTVFRDEGGYYTPTVNTVSFTIVASKLDHQEYQFLNASFEVDLYKDFTVAKQLLSTLKTNNKLIQVTASIFAKENQLHSCLLLNEGKNVVEATSGNLFMVMDGQLITPPISEGCLNGVMRKQILRLAKTIAEYTIVEAPVSPFDLQKADELFITNVIVGIQPISKYRKKEFGYSVAKQLIEKLNASITVD
jgi:branched-chain amino acid aminotransferase